jgi:transcription initiation factor IIE alpha subunit
MNRIASDLMRIASELLPRIKATFTKKAGVSDSDLNAIHFDIQRFVATLRKNEEIESLVSRRDDDKVMEIVVGFTDHEAMEGIMDSMDEMLKKLSRKMDIKVKVEVTAKK